MNVTFFAYGIFRQGYMHRDIGPCIAEEIKVPGRMFTNSEEGIALCKFYGADVGPQHGVVGDVYDVDLQTWAHICKTEFGAGYLPVIVLPFLDHQPHALAWEYMGDVGRCLEIVNGDWLEPEFGTK